MDAGAGLGGVEAEAGLGVGVVGDLGAAVVVDGGVGFARGDDGDTAGGEKGAETDAEGEGDGLFRRDDAVLVFKGCAGIVAAVGCVKDHGEVIGGRGLSEGWNGKSEKD